MIGNTAYFMDRLRAAFSVAALAIGPALFCLPCQAKGDGLNTSAEYIVGFFRYVQWPNEDQIPTWNICFVGALPHDQEKTYSDHPVRKKAFAIRNITASESISNCHALDLTQVSIKTARKILSRSRRMPILTIGTGSEFCSIGGLICLNLGEVDARQSQKFEVNLSTVKESRFEISARLLTIGRTLIEDGK